MEATEVAKLERLVAKLRRCCESDDLDVRKAEIPADAMSAPYVCTPVTKSAAAQRL
jgi:hypothetical protein